MAKDDWRTRDRAGDTVRRQQHTGNHPDQGGPARKGEGADAHGGTRDGAENVEGGRAHPRGGQTELSTRTRR